MKHAYDGMQVELLGAVGTVVNKTGTYVDCSQNFETKSFDAGGGQEANCD
jgi:hypothetical protein